MKKSTKIISLKKYNKNKLSKNKSYKDNYMTQHEVDTILDSLNYDDRVKKLIIILESTLEEWEHQL